MNVKAWYAKKKIMSKVFDIIIHISDLFNFRVVKCPRAKPMQPMQAGEGRQKLVASASEN